MTPSVSSPMGRNQIAGIFHILIVLGWSIPASSQCTQDFKLTSQAMVDRFVTDFSLCDTIKGNLDISGADILDLGSLAKVRVVEGYLHIHECPALLSLSGLEQLQSIGNSLALVRNHSLQSLDGLDDLRTIGLHLNLVANAQLTNIQGLLSLDSINGALIVVDHQRLIGLQGLNQIKSLGGRIEIAHCDVMTDLAGLDELRTIGSHLYLYKMKALQSVQGLQALQIIGGELEISENNHLGQLDDLHRLQSVGDCFDLYGNPRLSSVDGLRSLQSVGGALIIIQNNKLNQCAVEGLCQHLLDPPSTVSIWENGSICSSSSDFLKACAATPLNEVELVKIQVFPNPTLGHIKIHGLPDRSHTAHLYDSFGKPLRTLSIDDDHTFDLSDLPAGLYHLKIGIDGQYFINSNLSKL